MSRSLHLRECTSRLPLLLPSRRATTSRHTYAQWQCRLRCNSAFSPASIAALLDAPSRQPVPSDETLTLNGFVRSVRKQKRVAFAAIGDGSSLQTVQVVLTPEQAAGLSTGVAVAVTGRWKPSPGHEQTHELQTETLRILGQHDHATYPLQKKFHTAEFLRSLPHLRPRLPFNSLLLRLRSQVTAQITNYFTDHDFIQVHPPIITSSDCEGAGDVFTVTSPSDSPSSLGPVPDHGPKEEEDLFFQTPKHLTVSNQLHLEALAQSVGRVWTLSPTFRAEKSDTPRHLSEFYMLEAELAFVDHMSDIMDVVERMLRAVASGLESSHVGRELLDVRAREHQEDGATMSQATLAQRWRGLVAGPWPRITYNDAIQQLKHAVAQNRAQFEFAPDYHQGLQTEHERFIAESIGQGGPVFVTDYPRSIKPFYMAPSTSNSTEVPTVACFDLLVPDVCELVGGSIREHRLPELIRSMKDHGLRVPISSDLEFDSSALEGSLQWYVDLRRYGSVPHGGFGLGFDRLLCYLSGVSNVRDVVSFPRWYKRCDC